MQQQWPPNSWTPPPYSAYDAPRRPALGHRPPALLWACIVTWCCTGLAVVILAVSIVTLAQNSQSVLDEAYRQNPQLSEQGFTHHELLVVLYVVIGLVLAGSAAAATFALLVYRGRRWAYYALLGAAALSALFFLISALGSVIGLLPLAASVLTIVCLVRPEVRAWVVRR
jgi:MFS family permease